MLVFCIRFLGKFGFGCVDGIVCADLLFACLSVDSLCVDWVESWLLDLVYWIWCLWVLLFLSFRATYKFWPLCWLLLLCFDYLSLLYFWRCFGLVCYGFCVLCFDGSVLIFRCVLCLGFGV